MLKKNLKESENVCASNKKKVLPTSLEKT